MNQAGPHGDGASRDSDGLQVDALDRPGPPPELREPPRRSRALGAFIATFALAAFAGVVWYAYDRGLQAGHEATAPLIQADPSPIKVRPAQPGGLEVPNQDKLVYGALRPGQGEEASVERLLPPPEEPAPPPPPASVPSTSGGAASDGSATVPIPARTLDPEPPQTTGADLAPAPTPAPVPPVQVAQTEPQPQSPPQPVASGIPPARAPEAAANGQPTPPPVPPQPTPEATPPPPQPAASQPAASQPAASQPAASQPAVIQPAPSAAPPAAAPAQQAAVPAAPRPAAAPAASPQPPPAPASQPAGRFRVQLGAFRDEAAARREWDRLRGRFPDQLSGLTLRVQRVDLGPGKGVFHRIQGGMLSEQGARGTCEALEALNQPCLLVRP